ncbi:hypothetical protein STAN_7199 [Streptomyces sp. CBMAI 2042]|uniref:hypothetical protein n=1 Tax=Streptomyces sp. CBMAI 2042 TaxID=2305222 RepID=UPI000F106120|nr:hypothetical protein [Streptomyces sp. CBMAI 2042]RLV64379.1 hypothetical protein STAN_7199 [Streptomyces sp. CBMAI 2042]
MSAAPAGLPQPYHVVWTIDTEEFADPREAARYALEAVSDPQSWAHVFTVTDHDGNTVDVDLDETEETAERCRRRSRSMP